jgi:hypothetical protein
VIRLARGLDDFIIRPSQLAQQLSLADVIGFVKIEEEDALADRHLALANLDYEQVF